MNQAPVVDQFRQIVAATQANVLDVLQAADPDITGLYYQHGHYEEIEQTLKQYEESTEHYNQKYPLVALFEDILFRCVKGIWEAQFTLIICYNSDKEYKSKDRYEEVINPILMPIYDELVRQILNSGFYYGYQLSHDMIVHPFAGGQSDKGNIGTLFSDILDSIEMRNIKLKLYPVTDCSFLEY